MANELKAGAVLNYVSIAVRLVTSFFLTPFVMKSLGVEEYGLFLLSHSIIMWLSLSDLGLSAAMSRYVSMYYARGEREQEAHFLGQAMMLFGFLGLLMLSVGGVGFLYLDSLFPDLSVYQHEQLQIMYLLTLGNLALAFPLRPLGYVAGAHLRFLVPGVVSLVLSLLNAGLTVLLLCCGYRAIGLTVLGVGMSMVGMLWGLFYIVRYLGVRMVFRKPDMPLFRELFAFSFWLFLGQLMDLFYWRAGSPVLASLSGVEAVAVYGVGIFFAQHFMTASTAVSSVISPRAMHLVALQASKEELTRMMVRVGRIQAVILLPLLGGFAVYGEAFLQLWVGETLGENTRLAWLGALMLLVALAVPLTQNLGLALLQAMDLHKGRALILLYSSACCFVLGVVLSLLYGAIGMFMGTALSLLLGQGVLVNMYYHRRAGLNMLTFLRQTILPLVLPGGLFLALGLGMSCCWPTTSWGDFALQIGCYGLLGGVILYALYLNQEERAGLLSTLRKLW